MDILELAEKSERAMADAAAKDFHRWQENPRWLSAWLKYQRTLEKGLGCNPKPI